VAGESQNPHCAHTLCALLVLMRMETHGAARANNNKGRWIFAAFIKVHSLARVDFIIRPVVTRHVFASARYMHVPEDYHQFRMVTNDAGVLCIEFHYPEQYCIIHEIGKFQNILFENSNPAIISKIELIIE
jgi:hypothetical protein